MTKIMTRSEEIIYGEIFKILGKYLSVDDDTKNHIATEALATMVPVLHEMEKKISRAEKTAKSKAPQEVQEAVDKANTKDVELIIKVLKALWSHNDTYVTASHESERKYHLAITKYAATHMDRWSSSKAWLDSSHEFLMFRLSESKVSLIKWIVSQFPIPAVMEELLKALKSESK